MVRRIFFHSLILCLSFNFVLADYYINEKGEFQKTTVYYLDPDTHRTRLKLTGLPSDDDFIPVTKELRGSYPSVHYFYLKGNKIYSVLPKGTNEAEYVRVGFDVRKGRMVYASQRISEIFGQVEGALKRIASDSKILYDSAAGGKEWVVPGLFAKDSTTQVEVWFNPDTGAIGSASKRPKGSFKVLYDTATKEVLYQLEFRGSKTIYEKILEFNKGAKGASVGKYKSLLELLGKGSKLVK